MFVPKNFTEEQVLKIIIDVSKSLARRRSFGYFEEEDIQQEAFLIIEKTRALEKYDGTRPLENYLSRLLKNRLINFKRDNYVKIDSPCLRCPLKAYLPPDGCSAYQDKMSCKFYSRWSKDNASKQNIIHPTNIDNVEDVYEQNMSYSIDFVQDIQNSETDKKLLNELDTKARKYYLIFKGGTKLRAYQYRYLLEDIKRIYGKDINGQTP